MILAKKLDKFYTKKSIVKNLINIVALDTFDLVIEPSAGNGSFSDLINHKNLISMDLYPESKKILKKNWFNYMIPKKYKKVLIIGNPPFGKNNFMSKKFLEHAFSFKNVHTIAFVLPNVYKKYTHQKVIPQNFYINKVVDLGRNAFQLDGKDFHVPCSFFLISKNNSKDLRQNTDITTSDFSFSTKKDFDFFIFGAAPKKIISNPTKNNRGYFIKSHICKRSLLNKLNKIKWKGQSSANGGVYWLTKVDIIENYIRKENG